ncbi:hypothetical protein QKU58_gp070 [Pyramimonas orientalis virus]|uniref:Uncharacterized protein n=1 Tax=Pyramimonas orientalis virus 01B TaxID=3134525 RepID=A0A7M3UNJ8_9VIRU|nr:hypothetical protein QKU58_gp070 [Pyramimonas orientalis virus]QOI90261.1 hypothetical protein HWQ62_00124 [Pyramimonas orientalis virus]
MFHIFIFISCLCVLTIIVSLKTITAKTNIEHFSEIILDSYCAKVTNNSFQDHNSGRCTIPDCSQETCQKRVLLNGNNTYMADTSPMKFEASECKTKEDGDSYIECSPYSPIIPTVQYVQSSPTVQYVQSSPTVQYVQSSPTVQYVQSSPTVQYVQSSPTVQYVQSSPTVQYVQSSPTVQYVQSSPTVQYTQVYDDDTPTESTCFDPNSHFCFEHTGGQWIKHIYKKQIGDDGVCAWRNINDNTIVDEQYMNSCSKSVYDCASRNYTCSNNDNKIVWFRTDSTDGLSCTQVNDCDTCHPNTTISCYNFDVNTRQHVESVFTQSERNGVCNFYNTSGVPLESCSNNVVVNCKPSFVCNGETYEPRYDVTGLGCEYKSTTTEKVMNTETCVLDTNCPSDEYFNMTNKICSKCGTDYRLTNNKAMNFQDACTALENCNGNNISCYDSDCRMSIKRKIRDANNECVPPPNCDIECSKPPVVQQVRCRRDPRRKCVHPTELTVETYKYDKDDNCTLKSESGLTVAKCNPFCPSNTRLTDIDGNLKCI